jgi:hypothetical protein
MRRVISALFLLPLLVAAITGPAMAAATTFNIELEPEAAAPGASGNAKIRVLPEAGLICYTIKWENVGAPVTGGHIHSAGGDIEVSLFGGPQGTATDYRGDKFTVSGCVTASAEMIESILADPSSFYVNLHVDPTLFTPVLRGDLA